VTKFKQKRAFRPKRKSSHTLGLKYRGIVPKTRQRYERAISTFFNHLSSSSLSLAGSWSDLDGQVSNYIDHMFLEGEPVGYAGDLLSGLSRFVPGSRLRMPTARLWFRNWQREIVRKRALPIPCVVVKGMAGMALALNRRDLAVLLPLSFVCMLRTGELLGMQKRDIAFNPNMSSAVIRLPQTKTSGPNTEEVVLRDQLLVRALFALVENLRPGDTLYERPRARLGDDLRWLGKLVGFSHKRFTPYSLRRGGATWHFHAFGSLAKTASIGRWKHESTAKIYIDGAAAEWATWQFSPEAQKILERSSSALKAAFPVK
jgi:hypothetical protein